MGNDVGGRRVREDSAQREHERWRGVRHRNATVIHHCLNPPFPPLKKVEPNTKPTFKKGGAKYQIPNPPNIFL